MTKQAYEAPAIQSLGAFEEITRGGTSGDNLDQAIPVGDGAALLEFSKWLHNSRSCLYLAASDRDRWPVGVGAVLVYFMQQLADRRLRRPIVVDDLYRGVRILDRFYYCLLQRFPTEDQLLFGQQWLAV